MTRYAISYGAEFFYLDEQEAEDGLGVQASVIAGLGLGPVDAQYVERLDGSTYRRTRNLAQDFDMSVSIRGADKEDLQARVAAFSMAMQSTMTLFQVVDIDTFDVWNTSVNRVGGGSYDLGTDAVSDTEVVFVVTLRAGQPAWEHGLPESVVIEPDDFGYVTVESPGDTYAYPRFTIVGPGTDLQLISANGESITWNGTLEDGQTLFVDMALGTVTGFFDFDLYAGWNKYGDCGPAPKFWSLSAGSQIIQALMTGTDSGSSITCSWYPRKRTVL